VYEDFGAEIKMTLNPFIFKRGSTIYCFDEAAPCLLEQESICIVENNAQDVYVPWLICMDSNGDQLSTCNAQVGITDESVSTCVADDSALVDKYLAIDEPIGSTPTVYINGASVTTSYSAIKKALCAADSSLAACSSTKTLGSEAEEEITQFCTTPADIVA